MPELQSRDSYPAESIFAVPRRRAPLGVRLTVRSTGFDRHESGYIDV
ncbi:MAG TPA: hypothetical protein VN716_17745 [Vicinamibacterales bacterium]|nr:hypothetical protein [Vicinamibacterales bacterium]